MELRNRDRDKSLETLKELPPAPKDVENWIRNDVIRNRYVFYDLRSKIGICTSCGKTYFLTDKVKHNTQGKCPQCKQMIIYKAAGLGRKTLEERYRVLLFTKKGKVVYASLTMIIISYTEIDPTNAKPTIYKNIEAIWKFTRKEQISFELRRGYLDGYYWKTQKHIRIPYRTGQWKDVPIVLYQRNLSKVFVGTDLTYCDLPAQYKNDEYYFLKLIDLNAKFESVEKLHKAGFDRLVTEKIMGVPGSAAVRWKETNLKKILGLNAAEMKEVRDNEIGLMGLLDYKRYRAKGIRITVREASEIGLDPLKVFEEIEKYTTFARLLSYLTKQLEKIKRTYKHVRIDTVIRDYKDYIEECIVLGNNLQDKQTLFPKDLANTHRHNQEIIDIKRDEIQMKEVAKYQHRLKKYNWSDENFIIRAAESAEEIIEEGKAQQHCVGSYVSRVAAGQTSIFFVRRKNAPQEPYYTLELKGKNVIQCRGRQNKVMTEEIKAIVEYWVNKVVWRKKREKPA